MFWGTGREACGLDDVFPPNNLWFDSAAGALVVLLHIITFYFSILKKK